MSSCVVALLTANAFAIAMIVTDDEPEASEPSPARTLTLVTTADGHRYLVDPNTEAGRHAIADARQNGSTITQVTVPSTSSTVVASENPNTSFTLPPSGILPVDAGTVLDDTINTLLGTVSTVSSIVDKSATTASSILGSTQSTVTSILGSTPSSVATVSSTVSSTVGGVVTTVVGVVTTVTVPAPVTTLLGPLGSTGSSVTTTPTTVATNPICTLLDC